MALVDVVVRFFLDFFLHPHLWTGVPPAPTGGLLSAGDGLVSQMPVILSESLPRA
jgi:hypothetical protein